MAELGRWTRATRGHTPPKITAFTRFSFEALAFRISSSALAEKGMNPVSVRLENKSCRSEAMSRTVDAEIKLCSLSQLMSAENVSFVYLLTECFDEVLVFSFRAQSCAFAVGTGVGQKVTSTDQELPASAARIETMSPGQSLHSRYRFVPLILRVQKQGLGGEACRNSQNWGKTLKYCPQNHHLQ
jgi:hypothetical protein